MKGPRRAVDYFGCCVDEVSLDELFPVELLLLELLLLVFGFVLDVPLLEPVPDDPIELLPDDPVELLLLMLRLVTSSLSAVGCPSII